MADFAHSLPRTQPSSKKSSNGNGFAANVYEDVFGGASKFGIPTFTSRVEDYSEIFSSYNSSSRGSSIPFLDLPVAVDDETEFANVRCSKFDYNEIFGGFDSVDYAVPYEQLFLETKASAAGAEAESSSEDVWTPAGTGSPSEESSEDPVCSESNQNFSNIESHYAYDGAKQYNVSYHKTNQTSKEDVISGTTHIAQLNAVPAYTFVVDENLPLQTAKCDNPLPEVANDLNLDPDIADWKMDGEHFWETKPSQPACGNDQEPQKNLDLNGAYNRKPFITITEINLRTQPCEVPPPSRPPPKLTIKQGSHKDLKSSEKYARQGTTNDSSPTFFDVEVDISSSAAASAAAMKEAMQKAEARLKSAKEMMERKKDGLQHRKKMGIKEDSKGKEKWESRTAHDVVRVKEDKSRLKHERKDNDLKGFDSEEKQKGIGVAQAAPDLEMKPRLFKASDGLVNKKQPDECRLTQEPQREEVIGEWKAEEQFYELVKKDTSGTVLHTSGLGKSELNSIPITRVYEHGEYEKKAEKLAYEHQEKSDGNSEASKRTLELEEDIKRLNVAKEIWERAEHEDKMKAAQKFCDQEEQERRQVEAHALEESEKKRKEVLKQEHEKKLRETHEHEKKAREREEYEKKLQEAHEREEHEKKIKVDREREENEKKKKEALCREENERRQRETREREENEKKQEALEREENERRRKEAQDNERRINEKKLEEARQREESEKRQKEIREREENEKRLSESRERQENERRLKQAAEDNEKRLKELREREENERRVKEVREREENERRLKEVHEREENERRLKEVREKEENERRLEEVREREESERREREESERRQKKEHEREESERRHKEEREREESERRQKEEREREEESEKSFQEFYEREENERKLKQAAEENEMRQKEVHESEEREKIRKETQAQEENARRLETCEEVTAKLFQKKTCERVENEKKLRGAQDRDGSEMRPETVFEKITESDKNMKAGNDTCMQDDTKNTEANSGDPEQENNNTKLKSAQESRASEGYGETIESATSVSDHSDIVNNLKENEVSSEEDKIVRLRAAHSSSTSYGHEECKDHQIGASNAKVDNSEKKSEKIEDTVRQEKDKTCTKEGLVALDFKDKNNEEEKIVQSKVADEFNTNHESKKKNLSATTAREVSGKEVRTVKEKEHEKERLRKFEEDRQREKEREKDRMAVERVTREARERAYADARERAERAAVERATAEARQRAMTEARERLEKACAEAREKSLAEKAYTEARLRAERAAVERATAEARERAVEKAMAERAAMEAKERVERSVSEKFSATSRDSGLRQSASFSDFRDAQFQNLSSFSSSQRYPNSSNYAAFAADKSQGNEVESAQRCKARLERHQRTVERAAKALAEKNLRDYQAQREQTERNRLAETLDADVKRWSSGKEGNLRALLSTLQYILGPESHWQPVPLTEVITAVAVKKAYRKATLCVHPDKLQQRGASVQQKYICEKVFDLLKDAWNKFNSEER